MSSVESSIVICAYNEEKTIIDVVRACHQLNQQSEIIVVDDGSSDNTPTLLAQLMADLDFRYERLPVNKGKSWAMAHGVTLASKDIILFIDADISGLRKEHLDNMLQPLNSGTADMVLGQPSQTLIDYRIHPFRSLTGERALFKKDIEPVLNKMSDFRYGAETFINLYFRAQDLRIEYVLLEGLVHPIKYAKTNPLRASKEFIGEGRQIIVTLVKNFDLVVKCIEVIFTDAVRKSKRKIEALQKQIDGFIDRMMS